MLMNLDDLYQDVILDHSKKPRNFGALENAQSARGHNPRGTTPRALRPGRLATRGSPPTRQATTPPPPGRYGKLSHCERALFSFNQKET